MLEDDNQYRERKRKVWKEVRDYPWGYLGEELSKMRDQSRPDPSGWCACPLEELQGHHVVREE